MVWALTARKGRVGGAHGAAARLGMNTTTFLSRTKKVLASAGAVCLIGSPHVSA
jgi:hypothetical protein